MDANEDLAGALHLTDPWIAAITASRIEDALSGFDQPLAAGWDCERLAFEIRDVANIARGDAPQSDTKAKAELKNVADKARHLKRAIELLGDTAATAALFEALRREEERTGATEFDGDDFHNLTLQPLQAIFEIFARAASQIDTQRPQMPRWTEKEAQSRRVGFAVFLQPIFEAAFGAKARADSWSAAYGEDQPWPEFYQRVYLELFPNTKKLNLAEVLKEAARERPRLIEWTAWLDSP